MVCGGGSGAVARGLRWSGGIDEREKQTRDEERAANVRERERERERGGGLNRLGLGFFSFILMQGGAGTYRKNT